VFPNANHERLKHTEHLIKLKHAARQAIFIIITAIWWSH